MRDRLLLLCLLAISTLVATPCCVRSEDADEPEKNSGDLPRLRLANAFPNLRFSHPLWVGHAGDGSDRLFVVEREGKIWSFSNDPAAEEKKLFLDLSAKVSTRHNEEGLLALAFHPKFKENGQFFVCYSDWSPRRGVIARYTVGRDDSTRADPASQKVILEVEQPWGNHNGCSLLFGSDGYLYASFGDGGSAGDPQGNGQNLGTLPGSILRIDIDREADGRAYAIPKDNPFVGRESERGEIWAYGLRNVWRMSFDRETGDLWAGDVGQNAWEEIDLIVKGGNYGWKLREGKHAFASQELPEGVLDPVAEYGHDLGQSVTGGYVYRGAKLEALRGVYVYADFASGRFFGLRYAEGKVTSEGRLLHAKRKSPSSFGEDEAGELYVCLFYEGTIARFETE